MNKFTQKAFLQFFYPSLLVGIGLAISNVIDSVVVGNELGEAGLAAIGYSLPIYMLTNVIFGALSVGGSVQFSKLMGSGDTAGADKFSSSIIEASLIIGVILGMLGAIFTPQISIFLGASPKYAESYALTVSYSRIVFFTMPAFFVNSTLYCLIRSDSQEEFAGIAFFIGTITDIVLNVILVTLLKVGINGSAYATLTGQVVSIIFLLFHLLHKDRIISFKPYLINLREVSECIKIGFSSSNQYISQFIFILAVNHILVRLIGASGVAIFDVVLNVSYLAIIFVNAATDSLIPLAGTLFGERNFPELHNALRFSLIICISTSTIYLALLTVFALPLCTLFGLSSPSSLSIGVVAVRLYLLSAWFACFSQISGAYYQSTDRERATYIISLFRGLILLLGFTLILSGTNAYLFWLCYPLTEFFSLIVVQIIRKVKQFSSSQIVSGDRFYTVRFDHSMSNLSDVLSEIEVLCKRFEVSPMQSVFTMNTMEEVCVAIRDNTPADKAGSFYIIVTVVFEQDGQIRFCIRDNATAYNPFDIEAHRMSADNLDNLDALSGIGIMMVKKKAKEFNYRRYLNFNTLIVII